MPRAYLNPTDAADPYKLPTVLVEWYSSEDTPVPEDPEDRCASDAGYVWCICIPGCLPDSDFYGPFPTVEAAIEDAREVFWD